MKVDFFTLGCSKNLVDSEKLMSKLIAMGHDVRHDPERLEGSVAIVNTCGFIEDAKKESIDVILQLASQKRQGRLKKLYVMGCLSQRYRKELKEEIPEVDEFYGKFDFDAVLKKLPKGKNPEMSGREFLLTPAHYAYVKIAEGCDRTCSYCAIPLMTGKYKSRTIEDILAEVGRLTSQGVKEIQLIAQDLTYYGRDLFGGKPQISELVKKISDVSGLKWLRLHYAYPNVFPLDLLDVIAERENVCKYLDIALQHSSNHVLDMMRRNITREETLDLIKIIRERVKGIHLRTTLMVGHPGETEADFEDLKQFVKDVRFERMGAFAYSHEEGTWSWKHYKDDISEDVKQRRLDELMSIQESIGIEVNESKIGRDYKVIIDRKEGDFFIGRTEFDSPEVDPEVLIKDNDLTIGDFYQVKMIDTQGMDLIGKVINKCE